MVRAYMKSSWTILLINVLAFGLASLPVTKARDLVTEGRVSVGEEAKQPFSLLNLASGPYPSIWTWLPPQLQSPIPRS